MTRLALDEAAWTGRWRHRSVAEKSLLSLGLLLLAVTAPGPTASLPVLAVAVVAALVVARVPVRTYAVALAAPVAFLVVSMPALALSLGAKGVDPVWSAGWLHVERTGLETATEVAARSVAAMAAVLLLALTTPVSDLVASARRLRVPGVVVDVATVVYRMLFTLLDSVSVVRETQASRLGYAAPATARRSFGLLGAAVLRRAWTRSQRWQEGLTGRGWDGSLATWSPARAVSPVFVSTTALVLAALVGVSVVSR